MELLAALVGLIAGLAAGPVADRIGATRYAPGTPGHDPDDADAAFIAAPSSTATRAVLAVVGTAAGGLLTASVDAWEIVAVFGALAWLYLVAVTVDLQYCRLPNVLTYPAAGLAVAGAMALSARLDTSVTAAFVGLVAYPVLLLAAGALYTSLRGREGVFLGDVKLAASLGCSIGWLGAAWQPTTPVLGGITLLVYAALLGHLVGALGGLVAVRALERPFPFGPFLAFGWFIVVLLAGSLTS